jgi:CheY-like chemotaxis protein
MVWFQNLSMGLGEETSARPSAYLNSSPGRADAIMPSSPFDDVGLPQDLLIVEDDAIIALDFEDIAVGLGVKRVRAVTTVARALALIADRAPDFALLDVRLGSGNSLAVAEKLDELKIPFAFVTGYGADVRLPPAFIDRPKLPKPCSSDALQALLRHAVRG